MTIRKQTERRTYRQDRFEILIKRQKAGTATFNELTELDDLVNRDPELRERVMLEDILMGDSGNTDYQPPMQQTDVKPVTPEPLRLNLLGKIKAFLTRVFLLKTGRALNLHARFIALV